MKILNNKIILIISLVSPLLSILIDSYAYRGGIAYGLGIPFDFLLYMDHSGPPENKLELFNNLLKISFRVEVFLACVLVFFIVFKLVSLLIKKFSEVDSH